MSKVINSETNGQQWKSVFFSHAAAAKSLQSCLTLCDPIDGSPPGFAIPGILQARTLEWVAISFSNASSSFFLSTGNYCYQSLLYPKRLYSCVRISTYMYILEGSDIICSCHWLLIQICSEELFLSSILEKMYDKIYYFSSWPQINPPVPSSHKNMLAM